jgi:hypothetical protein
VPFQAADPGHYPAIPKRKKPRAMQGLSTRVSDGTRTRDRLDHNQELYQLSYAHHGPIAV